MHNLQDYEPVHDGVIATAKWEGEQVELNACLYADTAR